MDPQNSALIDDEFDAFEELNLMKEDRRDLAAAKFYHDGFDGEE